MGVAVGMSMTMPFAATPARLANASPGGLDPGVVVLSPWEEAAGSWEEGAGSWEEAAVLLSLGSVTPAPPMLPAGAGTVPAAAPPLWASLLVVLFVGVFLAAPRWCDMAAASSPGNAAVARR